MSADDQQFLDALASLPDRIVSYSGSFAEIINTQVDAAASQIRSTLSQSSWIPDNIRPKLPPPKPAPVPASALTKLESVQAWIWRNKVLTGCIVLACGTVVWKGYQSGKSARKVRRAKRARNGGRTEVVVIAGSASLPLTKSLALDMERRGFVVYIVCNAAEDEGAVSALSRPDIKPLTIDTTDPPKAGAAIERFALHLQSGSSPAPTVKPNALTLKSIILIPSLNYQTSPIATIPPSSFADLFNTHLLQPILTIQAFLPLLTSRLQPIGEKWVPPKVLVFTPSIISSINPPFHAPEATVCSALGAFTEVLTGELRPLDITVTHMQLGTFDLSAFVPARQNASLGAGNPEDTLIWPDGARHVYGRNFMAQTSSAISGGRIRGLKGSSLRHLHNSVFDVIDGSLTADTIRVGLGASMYGFVGRFAPRSLVSWMMGIRKVDQLSTWKTSSYEGSSREGSENGDEGSASEQFVAVTPEKNIWRSDVESTIWGRSPSQL